MSVYTLDKLSDHELVALVLGIRPDDEAAGRIASAMATDGWLGGVPLVEIARECGSVGARRLQRLEASVELGRRALAARAARNADVISTPEDVVNVVKPLLVGRDREHFLALALNTKNRLLKIIEVSVGSLSASVVHPREMYKDCISVSAASVIVVHNHPSGNGGAQPSGADIQLCRRLAKAGDVLGIDLLDAVIVAGDEYSSCRDLGLL